MMTADEEALTLVYIVINENKSWNVNAEKERQRSTVGIAVGSRWMSDDNERDRGFIIQSFYYWDEFVTILRRKVL